jgi:hypothetical protein
VTQEVPHRIKNAGLTDRLHSAGGDTVDPKRNRSLCQPVQSRHLLIDGRDLVRDMVVHFLNIQRLDEHGQSIDLAEGPRHFDQQHRLTIDDVVSLRQRLDRLVEGLMQLALTRQQIVQILQRLLAIAFVARVHDKAPFLTCWGLRPWQRQ